MFFEFMNNRVAEENLLLTIRQYCKDKQNQILMSKAIQLKKWIPTWRNEFIMNAQPPLDRNYKKQEVDKIMEAIRGAQYHTIKKSKTRPIDPDYDTQKLNSRVVKKRKPNKKGVDVKNYLKPVNK